MKAHIVVKLLLSALVAFISTNIYWILTVSYAKSVTSYGEPSVLTGVDAAKHLISEYGFKVYLSGMSAYYIVCLFLCSLICMRAVKKGFLASLISTLVFCVIGAVVFYIIDLKIYVGNRVTGTSEVISGYSVIAEVGYAWFFVSLLALTFLLFLTVVANLWLCRHVEKTAKDNGGSA